MLKLRYFSHMMQTADSLEKTLMMGKIAVRRRRGQQRMRWLDGITDSMDMSLGDGEGQGSLECSSPWGCEELNTIWRLNNHWIIPWVNNSIPGKGEDCQALINTSLWKRRQFHYVGGSQNLNEVFSGLQRHLL